MNYLHKEIKGADVIELNGSIDLYSTPIIKKFIKALLRSEETRIIITMEAVSFIDSSGLGMLINLFFECQQRGCSIKIANMSPESRRIFALTGMDIKFVIFDSLDEALIS